ncbi:MAG: spore maturation protein A [Oscillospiraceae bacterium]
MILSVFICGMLLISISYAALSGNISLLSTAALEGAKDAVGLCLSLCGTVCLWSGVMELMARSGLADKLSRLLKPILCRLFPNAVRDEETSRALSQNVSANLLGLGNAATPAGIRAALGMQRQSGSERAGNELCLLVVLNTASIQLIPATAAALRASLGAAAPFDILPAVWLSSLCSVTAGIFAARMFARALKA